MAKLLLFEEVPQAWVDGLASFLRERQPEGIPLDLVMLAPSATQDSEALLGSAEVIVVGLTGQQAPLTGEIIAKAPALRLIQKLGSRAAGVDLDAARQASVQVSLLPAPAHIACAEHTMLLILALAKKLIPAHQKVTRRPLKEIGRAPKPAAAGDYAYNWAGLDGIGLVAGRTLGLVGIGDIAIEVARRAKAFGLNVIYCDKDGLPQDEERTLGIERREMDALVAEADIVSLHVALTPETQGILNAERMGKMKASAFVINTARGGLVDEEALATALREGRLAGAALDAWAAEPTPKDNPLLKLDNVVATPHVAAGTLTKTAIFEAILPNILKAFRGETVVGSLTPEVTPKPAREPEPPVAEPPAPETPPADASDGSDRSDESD